MLAKERKVFFLYTIAIAILVLTGFITRYVYKAQETYFFITRVYNLVEYSLLAYFFSLHIKKKFVKKILLYSPIIFALFCFLNFISAKEPSLPFIPLIVEYIILLVFIIYFFFEVMQETVVEPIYHRAIFWISVAFIINFSGNFFLFLYSKNSFNDEVFQRQYTIIYSSVTILKNILLCISILVKENKKSLTNNPFDSVFDNLHPFNN